jgi:rhodanese-related sulfurtransferase
MAHASGFVDLVEAQKTNIKEIDVDTLKSWADGDKDFVLVDVREDREWINGHLPNAVHMGKGVIERDIAKNVDDADTTLVLYCGGGYRSVLAAHNIQLMGYNDVYSLAGGWRDWSSKYETVQPE